ncbi:MAG TPA: hypothetical protein VFV53_10275 [Candidatus Limnocylindrales bacterium]|nr:hypothetical protein [Candidatus Limnocylindrales bacterium]
MIVDRTAVLVAVSISVFAISIVFVVLMALAWWRRNRGLKVGPPLEASIALVGGAALGAFVVASQGMLPLDVVFVVTASTLAYTQWRRRRRRQAGFLIAGFALPWTVLWGYYVVALGLGVNFEPAATWAGFLGGLGVVAVGLALVARGDPPAPPPDPRAAPGEPGSRQIGTIAAAIFGPARIGPFRTPDVASLVALVASLIGLALLPIGNQWIHLGVVIVVSAVIASEAWIRALPARTRLAFEAFSWLGEDDIERARALTGSAVPVTPAAAEAWLRRVPESPLTDWVRAEVLLLARRPEEARAIVDRMPADTPAERFELASTRDLVEWANGGDGDTTGMEAALEALGPEGSDARLRGEVTIAAARVRHAMSYSQPAEGDVLEPLVEVRRRLWARADGQVGRAMRKRLIPAYLLFSALFGIAGQLILGGTAGLFP